MAATPPAEPADETYIKFSLPGSELDAAETAVETERQQFVANTATTGNPEHADEVDALDALKHKLAGTQPGEKMRMSKDEYDRLVGCVTQYLVHHSVEANDGITTLDDRLDRMWRHVEGIEPADSY